MANFLTTVCELRGGLSVHDLDAKLTEVVAAVRSTGKVGKLMLTLVVNPASKGSREATALLLEDQVKVTLPSMDRERTILFVDPENNELSRRDPRQMELDGLKEPETRQQPSVTELRVVG